METASSIPELDPTAQRVSKRARRQRGCFFLAALWVLGWTALCVNGLIQYNHWVMPVWSFAMVNLFISPFTLIFTLPLALAGYWIGQLPLWKDYRFYWAMSLPVAAAILIQFPTLMNRLDPARRFPALTGIQLPESATITSYQSRYMGIDGSITFELMMPQGDLESLYSQLAKEAPDSDLRVPTVDGITRDFGGAMLEVDVDRPAGTMTVSYLSY